MIAASASTWCATSGAYRIPLNPQDEAPLLISSDYKALSDFVTMCLGHEKFDMSPTRGTETPHKKSEGHSLPVAFVREQRLVWKLCPSVWTHPVYKPSGPPPKRTFASLLRFLLTLCLSLVKFPQGLAYIAPEILAGFGDQMHHCQIWRHFLVWPKICRLCRWKCGGEGFLWQNRLAQGES